MNPWLAVRAVHATSFGVEAEVASCVERLDARRCVSSNFFFVSMYKRSSLDDWSMGKRKIGEIAKHTQLSESSCDKQHVP